MRELLEPAGARRKDLRRLAEVWLGPDCPSGDPIAWPILGEVAEHLERSLSEVAGALPELRRAWGATPLMEGCLRPCSMPASSAGPPRAAGDAAVSAREELYSKGMPARRALLLAHGALPGEACLSVEEVRRRVSGRYLEAQPLPGRTELDALLKEAGWDFRWSGDEDCFLRLVPLLLPADEQQELPVLDGRPIPILTPGQRARVPRGGLKA